MKHLTKLLMAVALLGVYGSAQSKDTDIGKEKATAICAACHGPDGISINPLWPSLAAQKKDYIIKQLKAFRDGTRADPAMSPMAKPLTDADIENLAAHYSSLKCK